MNIELALTIDDIPRNGHTIIPNSNLNVVQGLTNIFKLYKLPPVYGFANCSLAESSSGYELLQHWLETGNKLGNHTYSHLDLRNVSLEEYLNDIEKNDIFLSKISGNKDYNYCKYFRYPYLLEGETKEKYRGIKKYLNDNNYKITQVTIDFLDFAWEQPLLNCLRANNAELLDELKKLYVDTAISKLLTAHKAANEIFQRNIKHVLVVHSCLATAMFLEKVIQEYKENGVKFISLSEAIMDPVYETEINVISDIGPNFLRKIVIERKLDLLNKPTVPTKRLKEIEQYSSV
ncbi:MAG TPA: polysaccharide deacetylase family protein [Patescibacteria group bacterium]|nr:polysaccharide deacetylase family protein [Gammaproteobacteria bacterium]HWA51477.1 polysaccharide deacetylase family protein [Patescibacteria group bacterium]